MLSIKKIQNCFGCPIKFLHLLFIINMAFAKISIDLSIEQINELPLSCGKCKTRLNFANLIQLTRNIFIHTFNENESLILCHVCFKNNGFKILKPNEMGYIQMNIDGLFPYNLYIYDNYFLFLIGDHKCQIDLKEFDIDIIKFT